LKRLDHCREHPKRSIKSRRRRELELQEGERNTHGGQNTNQAAIPAKPCPQGTVYEEWGAHRRKRRDRRNRESLVGYFAQKEGKYPTNGLRKTTKRFPEEESWDDGKKITLKRKISLGWKEESITVVSTKQAGYKQFVKRKNHITVWNSGMARKGSTGREIKHYGRTGIKVPFPCNRYGQHLLKKKTVWKKKPRVPQGSNGKNQGPAGFRNHGSGEWWP